MVKESKRIISASGKSVMLIPCNTQDHVINGQHLPSSVNSLAMELSCKTTTPGSFLCPIPKKSSQAKLPYNLNISKVKIFEGSWLLAFCDKYFADCKTQYRIVMQHNIFKVKFFEVTHKSMKSMKIFSLTILRLYGSCTRSLWAT